MARVIPAFMSLTLSVVDAFTNRPASSYPSPAATRPFQSRCSTAANAGGRVRRTAGTMPTTLSQHSLGVRLKVALERVASRGGGVACPR
jgi:hypothetical protein